MTPHPVRAVGPRVVDLRLVPAALGSWLTAIVVTHVAPGSVALAAAVAVTVALVTTVVLVTAVVRAAPTAPPTTIPPSTTAAPSTTIPPPMTITPAIRRPSVVGRALVRAGGHPGASRSRGGRLPAVALAIVAAAGTLLSGAAQRAATSHGLLPEAALEQATITLVGTVTGDAHPQAPGWPGAPARVAIVVAAQAVTSHGRTGRAVGAVLVVGPPSWATVPYRARVAVTGRVQPARPGERPVAVLASAAAPHVIGPSPGWARAASAVRARVLGLAERQPAPTGALLAGITVGDTRGLPDGVVADLRTVGLTHVTAVSGAHFSLVVALVLALASTCRAPRGVQALCAVVATGATVALVHPDASVVRAAAMGLVGVLGLLAGRAARAPAALAASIVVLLTTDPWLATELGFVLSVCATAGLVLLGGPLTERWSTAVGRSAAQALALPVAAQLVCAPVLLVVTPGIATYAVPANLLAAPAVGPATVLGLLAGLVAPIAPGPAEVLAACAGAACWWITQVAHVLAHAPGARIGWAPGVAGVVVLGAATACLCALLLGRARSSPTLVADARGRQSVTSGVTSGVTSAADECG